MSDDGEANEGLEGLDDALGDVIARKTVEQKRVQKKHGEKLRDHEDQLDRLRREVDRKVDAEAYARELATARGEALEALGLARDLRSQVASQGPEMRDEIMSTMRTELDAGISAQHLLATSHAQSIAELQKTRSDHEGRLAIAEQMLRSIDQTQRERSGALEDRLAGATGESAAKVCAGAPHGNARASSRPIASDRFCADARRAPCSNRRRASFSRNSRKRWPRSSRRDVRWARSETAGSASRRPCRRRPPARPSSSGSTARRSSRCRA